MTIDVVDEKTQRIGMATGRILIIDDEQAMLCMLRTCLQKAGYRVIIADKGEFGIQCACEKEPDLILLDVAMPEMNGYEVMKRIRAECDIPIVMLTGYAQLDDVLNGNNPPDTYIQKPANLKQLLATIDYLLVPSSGL